MNKKIAVLIITYNQEDVIKNTLDSIFKQREWGLSQVIVGDDCSQDHTWDILKEYQALYPEIMRPVRNEVNMGIYPNFEHVRSLLLPCDLLFFLAGDDPICDGYFKGLQKCVQQNNIDTSKPVGIFSDWKKVYPDGKEKIFKQDISISGINLVSLVMRLKLYNRSIVISPKVMESYETIIFDQGLRLAEMIFEVRAFKNIENVYYFPQVTTTYYTQKGISTKLSIGKSDYYTRQSMIQWQYFKDNYAATERDSYYCEYELIKASFWERPTWKKYFKMFHYYLKGMLPKANNSILSIGYLFYSLAKYKVSWHS